jgi:hypothetical protein
MSAVIPSYGGNAAVAFVFRPPSSRGKTGYFATCLRALSAAGGNYGDASRSPGPPLGRLTPRRCRLALTPGQPPQNGAPTPCSDTAQGVPAGTKLAGYPCGAWVWRGVSGRPGAPAFVRPTNTWP